MLYRSSALENNTPSLRGPPTRERKGKKGVTQLRKPQGLCSGKGIRSRSPAWTFTGPCTTQRHRPHRTPPLPQCRRPFLLRLRLNPLHTTAPSCSTSTTARRRRDLARRDLVPTATPPASRILREEFVRPCFKKAVCRRADQLGGTFTRFLCVVAFCAGQRLICWFCSSPRTRSIKRAKSHRSGRKRRKAPRLPAVARLYLFFLISL